MSQTWSDLGIDTKGRTAGKFYTDCHKCSHDRKKKNAKCLTVDLDAKWFKCHHCDWKGHLQDGADTTTGFRKVEKKEYKLPIVNNTKLSDKTLRWLVEGRHISKATVMRWGITESIEYVPQIKLKRNTINFNYFRDGVLINTKYRDSLKNFFLVAGAELIFYGLEFIYGNKEVTICEGEIDSLSFYESGVHSVVSVPNGANKKTQNLIYLDNCWQYFEDKERIYLALDNDENGLMLREELARRLGKDKCLIVNFPEGCKDANEVLIKYGAEKLLECKKNATEYPLEGITTIQDIEEQINNIYLKGYPKGDNIGFEEFDKLLTFRKGEFTVISGAPSCFTKEQLIHTKYGIKPISEIKKGEFVLSYNHESKINEFKEVTNTIENITHPDKLYEIKMKDGTIIKVTENHEFFTGTSYVKIKEILLSLTYGKNMEKNT